VLGETPFGLRFPRNRPRPRASASAPAPTKRRQAQASASATTRPSVCRARDSASRTRGASL
jgi:hypothetical protein